MLSGAHNPRIWAPDAMHVLGDFNTMNPDY